MRRLVALLAFACAGCTSAPQAQCRLADTLVRDYGISFSGFDKALPRVLQAPQPPAPVLDLALPNSRGDVRDGFEHRALVSLPQREAWIHRTGGFAGVNEWYGPVPVAPASLEGCAPASAEQGTTP
ncbi:hypothetical protein E4K72_15360 [Oxalobacteraceae bacterium OM1]|nr:hypothetical protein E4K72_15360 [Oxalobacteraceae bacterium OM1]